jgi:hypothetical protein
MREGCASQSREKSPSGKMKSVVPVEQPGQGQEVNNARIRSRRFAASTRWRRAAGRPFELFFDLVYVFAVT